MSIDVERFPEGSDEDLLAEAISRAAGCGRTEDEETAAWEAAFERLIQRLSKAEAIIHDLVKADRNVEDRYDGNQYCFFCFSYWDRNGRINHDADCVFRRAKELDTST